MRSIRSGWRRLALLALVAGPAACEGGGPAAPGEADRDGDGLADAVEAVLAAQYRPYWLFDGSETIHPISVSAWAGFGGRLVQDGAALDYDDPVSLLAAVRAFPEGTLHLPTGPLTGTGGAPVYVEAAPLPRGARVAGRSDLVWLHYWLLFPDDVKVYLPARNHRGDWEHVCVLVERGAAGDRDRPPVMIHWHHHGGADIAAEAYAWHADPQGAWHPRAYVEAGGHGIYREPGTFPGQHDDGDGTIGDPLAGPLVFLLPHEGQAGAAAAEAEVVRVLRGRWGQTLNAQTASPVGPLVFGDPCDHDYVARPTAASFVLSGCGAP